MKALHFSKSLFLVFIAAFIAIPVFADTVGTLSLSGIVAPQMSIAVSAEAAASNLPVGSDAQDLRIGSVKELTNNKAGYTVGLSSLNAGRLVESSSGFGLEDSLHYTLSYKGQVFDLANGNATISDVSQRTTGMGTVSPIYISFGAKDLNANTYRDTLTFTIAAK